MKTMFFSAAVGFVLVACGGGDSEGQGLPEPNFVEIRDRFEHPDGTLNNNNGSQVVAGASGNSTASLFGAIGGGSSSTSSGTKTASLHPLANAGINCDSLQPGNNTSGTCTCAEGGTVDVAATVTTSADNKVSDAIVKIRLNNCGVQGIVANGNEYVNTHTDVTDSTHPNIAIVTVADLTATKGTLTEHVALNMRLSNSTVEYAVQVNDGWVVVSADAVNGTLTIRDRNGSWTCTRSGAQTSCTGSNGQQASF